MESKSPPPVRGRRTPAKNRKGARHSAGQSQTDGSRGNQTGGGTQGAEAKGDNQPHRPVGRPEEYDQEYCKLVVTLGMEGRSRAEIASALGCSRQRLIDWSARHPEFRDALIRAKDEELAWWEAQARSGIHLGSDFNASLWAKCVSGRFPSEPYRDRMEHTGPNGGPILQRIERVIVDPQDPDR